MSSRRWSPEGFEAYLRLYPSTPPLPAVDDRTAAFGEAWRAIGAMGTEARRALLSPIAGKVAVVLVRGYLGNWMPGNFIAPARALRELGVLTVIARSAADGPIARNAKMLGDLVRRDTPDDVALVFGGHSRGGLEAMLLVAEDRAIATRTRAIFASQTPRGPSPVLESMLLGEHRSTLRAPHRKLAESVQRTGLRVIGAARGGRELTRDPMAKVARAIEEIALPCPVLHTASWSSTPTTWLDSFHERLQEIAPGRAHDGQFFLDDLLWPKRPHVLLPHLDHAQPVMGGHGFDHVRYWLATLAMTLELRL